MCGIAGLISQSLPGIDIVRSMLHRLRHRGPDGEGIVDLSGRATFGHRRLAIVGLGEAGKQPMRADPLVMTYNGEIYNHTELRARLEREGHAPPWQGTSDTETLLAAVRSWGLESTLASVDGMFAFALWNDNERQLTLVRDRMGEKPIYFGWIGDAFAFASELDALTAVPGWQPRLHAGSVDGFLRHGFVSGAHSIVQGVYRLPPGTIMQLTENDLRCEPTPSSVGSLQRRYWRLDEIAASSRLTSMGQDDTEKKLEELLRQAVRDRMTADVPVGAFLSGGVDSSLITALMQATSTSRVHTFSIGFSDARLDESKHARKVAGHLRTEHTEFQVRSDDALEIATALPHLLDEPLADASQLPTMLLARLARTKVKVALSGDGADELFAGYGRYSSIVDMWTRIGRVPAAPRRWAANAMQSFAGGPSLAGRAARWTERASTTSLDAMRLAYIGAGTRSHLHRNDTAPYAAQPTLSKQRQIMLADQLDFLPDDILQKVDRATMRYGLESRAPFLDHRVIAFSWSIPDALLPTHGVSKPLLRSILRRYVPDSLIDRPKQGFEPPMGEWLRGPLASWVESALGSSQLSAFDGLNVRRVRHMWSMHKRQRADFSRELWPIALLSAWTNAHGIDA